MFVEFSPYWIVGNEEQRVEERVHWIVGNEEQRVERKSSWFVLLSSFIAKIVEEMKCDGIMNFRLA